MSIEQKHTPGPWETDGTNVFHQLNPGGRKCLLAMVSREPIIEQARANARLIAAAPELLEACIAALHAVDVALCGTPGAHYFNAVKTALKKANATTIEDNLAINVTEIKAACEKARGTITQAIAKVTNP